MERLFGETLADRLEREGKLPLSEVIILLSQALSGLGAAHAGGIVHRDMKPENVFICRPAGGESIVKVLDFGASKLDRFSVSRQDDLEDLTATGFAVGTPYYMSPEQARGERELDGRVDIFACGIILYEALTGVRPFEGKNFQEVFTKIVAAEYVPACQLVPELPRAVDEVLRHALGRRREDRFPTAESFGRAVEGLKGLVPAPPEEQVPEEPSTERLAYLRQRFHELAVLYRKKGKGGRGQSSLEIPIFFDEDAMAPSTVTPESGRRPSAPPPPAARVKHRR
jgi:serine/threonine-protein kinase